MLQLSKEDIEAIADAVAARARHAEGAQPSGAPAWILTIDELAVGLGLGAEKAQQVYDAIQMRLKRASGAPAPASAQVEVCESCGERDARTFTPDDVYLCAECAKQNAIDEEWMNAPMGSKPTPPSSEKTGEERK